MSEETHPGTLPSRRGQLYLDCFSGIAGDMFLGALLDLGLPRGELESALRRLPLPSWTLSVEATEKLGIRGLKVHFRGADGLEEPAALPGEPDRVPTNAEELPRTEEPATKHHHHGHGHPHEVAEASHEHRSAREIFELIEAAALPEPVTERALSAFRLLAEAEGRVHGCSPGDVHFHELGMLDSVLDIVGCAWGLWRLGIEQVTSAPPPIGRGWVRCAHGNMPLPAPATSLLLEGCPVSPCSLRRELVTPTGAALLRAWVSDFGELPEGRLMQVGWGAGTIDLPDRPNLLRLFLFAPETPEQITKERRIELPKGQPFVQREEFSPSPSEQEREGGGRWLTLLEANIDDRSPELIGYLAERLREAGARDVWSAPIMMKKGRPGVVLSCLVDPERAEALTALFFTEGISAGLRRSSCWREALPRRWIEVEVYGSQIPVKLIGGDAVPLQLAPEYENCRQLALQRSIPLRSIYARAVAAASCALGCPTEDETPPPTDEEQRKS